MGLGATTLHPGAAAAFAAGAAFAAAANAYVGLLLCGMLLPCCLHPCACAIVIPALQTLAVHTDSVWCLAASADLSFVYSGGRDGAVYATHLGQRKAWLLAREQQPVRDIVSGAGSTQPCHPRCASRRWEAELLVDVLISASSECQQVSLPWAK